MPETTDRKPMKLWLLLCIGFAGSLLLMGLLMWAFAAYTTGNTNPWNHEPPLNQDEQFGVIRNAVTAAAALGIGVTLVLSYRRQRTAERNQETVTNTQRTAAEAQKTAAEALALSTRQHELELERRKDAFVSELRSRYSTAAEQLGASSVAVQLAGVYAMATLADEWSEQGSRSDRQTCIELLTGYYRMLDEEVQTRGEDLSRPIRTAIWESLSERFHEDSGHGGPWAQASLTLSGTRLTGRKISGIDVDAYFDFSHCSTDEARFDIINTAVHSGGLKFVGLRAELVEFRDCSFLGGTLDMTFTSASKGIRFIGCEFSGSHIILDYAAADANVEFVNCVFTDMPQPLRRLFSAKKLKFVDCLIRTLVIDDKTSRTLARHERIVRGCTYENDVPKIQPYSLSKEELMHLEERERAARERFGRSSELEAPEVSTWA
ncbi:hypothetical protein [Pseudarthrobacter sp. lyk4-40-TYG-27]|uniref:hypothetical protein n=1 Tax=Pseudarthrobacter sp. lyk4-40-TYG-27 TaxID=3040305 RepID=UPI002555FE05|nr:hypothetical protein [Pseudarthrobacter sp. lyk4-40-TYG-27]